MLPQELMQHVYASMGKNNGRAVASLSSVSRGWQQALQTLPLNDGRRATNALHSATLLDALQKGLESITGRRGKMMRVEYTDDHDFLTGTTTGFRLFGDSDDRGADSILRQIMKRGPIVGVDTLHKTFYPVMSPGVMPQNHRFVSAYDKQRRVAAFFDETPDVPFFPESSHRKVLYRLSH